MDPLKMYPIKKRGYSSQLCDHLPEAISYLTYCRYEISWIRELSGQIDAFRKLLFLCVMKT